MFLVSLFLLVLVRKRQRHRASFAPSVASEAPVMKEA